MEQMYAKQSHKNLACSLDVSNMQLETNGSQFEPGHSNSPTQSVHEAGGSGREELVVTLPSPLLFYDPWMSSERRPR